MNASANLYALPQAPTDWLGAARSLGQQFGQRADAADSHDRFVVANYTDLERYRFFSAGVPAELGGGGLDHRELGAVLRELGRHCASTALAFSMHTHQVAALAWRWRTQHAPVDALLARIAQQQLVLLSSGGSDWLMGSGTATRVDGGFRIDARKVFASGAPAADLFLTTAVYDDAQAGPTVLHLAVPMDAQGVRVLSNWRALGMRGTGSNDVVLDGVFVPDSAVTLRRPRGRWHPAVHLSAMIAIPLIYAVYVGVAEAARDIALERAKKRGSDAHLIELAGRIDNEVLAAQLALDAMFATAATGSPGLSVTQRVMAARTLVARAVLQVVDLSLEIAGGGGFLRDAGLERRFRDAQACRYHPLQQGVQQDFAGRLALGLDVDADATSPRSAA